MRPKARIVYDRNHGLPGHIVLRGQSSDNFTANMLTFELQALSKFIWGRGAAANSIFNCGACIVKFQGDAATNLRRAKTLSWAWRLATAYGINIRKLPVLTVEEMRADTYSDDRATISRRLADRMA